MFGESNSNKKVGVTNVVLFTNVAPECTAESANQLVSSFGDVISVKLFADPDKERKPILSLNATTNDNSDGSSNNKSSKKRLQRILVQYEEVEDAVEALENLHGASYFDHALIGEHHSLTD